MGKQKKGGSNASKGAKDAARQAEEDAFLEEALAQAAVEELVLNAVVSVDNSIDKTKPATDKKSYRMIQLSNGMECLLIHDSDDEGDDEESDDDEESNCTRNSNEKLNGSGSAAVEGGGGGGESGESRMEDDESQEEEEDSEDGQDDDGEEQGDEGGSGSKSAGSKRAAAAMAVGVGSWSDPPQAQGLAHFLEHMLFMGSSKYPKENHYDAIVQRYGGATNAFTECEHTVYHFEVYPRKFSEVLDVFAQFFVGEPLFREDAVLREIQSIESEFVQTKNSDESRMDELLCRAAPEGHPYGNFTWGNHQSLIDEPKANGVDLHVELRKFYNDYYHPKRMKLAITSSQSLDEMQDLVARTFISNTKTREDKGETSADMTVGKSSKKKKKGSKGTNQVLSSNPTKDLLKKIEPLDHRAAMGRLVLVAAVSEVHELRLTWPLPEQLSKWRSKPADLCAHLVGHESEGSALSLLRKKGWGSELTAGVGDTGLDTSTCGSLFKINVTLTNEGLKNWLDCISIIFKYVDLVRRVGVEKWVFDEVAAITAMGYQYREEDEAADLVEDLAVLMLPSFQFKDEVLRGSELLYDWEPQQMKDILNTLTPEKGRLEILSSNFATPHVAAAEDDEGSESLQGKQTSQKKRGFSDMDVDEASVGKSSSPSLLGEGEKEPGVSPLLGTELPFAGVGACNCRQNRLLKSQSSLSAAQLSCKNALCQAMFAQNSAFVDSNSNLETNGENIDEETSFTSLKIKSQQLVKSPPFDIPCSNEPRFGTQYWDFLLDQEYIDYWNQACTNNERSGSNAVMKPENGDFDSLALPQPNPFIAKNFDLKFSEEEKNELTSLATFEETSFLKELKIDFDALKFEFEASQRSRLNSLEDSKTLPTSSTQRGKKGKKTSKQLSTSSTRKKDEKPLASIYGPPFMRPSHSPTPIVPDLTMLCEHGEYNGPSPGEDKCHVELWHLNGYLFALPRLEVYLRFVSPQCHASVQHCVASELYVMLFNDYIAERNYLASMAGIDFTCKIDESGFVFHYTGFSDVLNKFILETFHIFLQLSTFLSLDSKSTAVGTETRALNYNHLKRFNSCKERLEKHYLNYYLKPSKQANRLRRCVLKMSNSFQPNLKLRVLTGVVGGVSKSENESIDIENNSNNNCNNNGGLVTEEGLKGISLQDMSSKWLPLLTQHARVQLFECGNCNKEDALKLARNVKTLLINEKVKPLASHELPKQPILSLKKQIRQSSTLSAEGQQDTFKLHRVIMTVCSDDPAQSNSACELYWQIGPDCLRHRILIDIIEQMINESLFDTLRTKEQLGYSVSCGARWTNGILGFGVHVLSNTHHPEQITERVVSFLSEFRESLNHYTEELEQEFREQCESLVAMKLEKCTNLSQQCSEHWEVINQCRTNMNEQHELNKTPTQPFSNHTKFPFLQNRTEAQAIPKVSLSVVKLAMDQWFGFPPVQSEGQQEVTAASYEGGCFLGVYCLGREAKHIDASKHHLPAPQHVQVRTIEVGKTNFDEDDTGASASSSSSQVWEGPIENMQEAFVDFRRFPCFVSGGNTVE